MFSNTSLERRSGKVALLKTTISLYLRFWRLTGKRMLREYSLSKEVGTQTGMKGQSRYVFKQGVLKQF